MRTESVDSPSLIDGIVPDAPPEKAKTPKDKTVGIDDSSRGERQPPRNIPTVGLAPLCAAEPQRPPPPAQPEREYPPEVVRRAQPRFLLRPDVVARLGLSQSQQAHLRRIAPNLQVAEQEPDSSHVARQIARGRLGMAVLTAKQREALSRLETPVDAAGGPTSN